MKKRAERSSDDKTLTSVWIVTQVETIEREGVEFTEIKGVYAHKEGAIASARELAKEAKENNEENNEDDEDEDEEDEEDEEKMHWSFDPLMDDHPEVTSISVTEHKVLFAKGTKKKRSKKNDDDDDGNHVSDASFQDPDAKKKRTPELPKQSARISAKKDSGKKKTTKTTKTATKKQGKK